MPVRAKSTIPIRRPRRGVAPAALPAAEVAEPPPMLRVELVRQTQNQWCWAACAQMVAAYYGNRTVTQCSLANFLHGRTNCCQRPGSEACNRPSQYEGVGRVFNHLRIECISHLWAVNTPVVLKELRGGRPVEVGLLWFGGGGHAVIVYGLTPQGLWAVHDPWYGTGVATDLYLRSAYGRGRWGYSFGNLHPRE
jgi:Papain-like cysteine protease AvrRpt2